MWVYLNIGFVHPRSKHVCYNVFSSQKEWILNVLKCDFLELLLFLNMSWDLGVLSWSKYFYWIHWVRSFYIWCEYLKSKWILKKNSKKNDLSSENELRNSLGVTWKKASTPPIWARGPRAARLQCTIPKTCLNWHFSQFSYFSLVKPF